MRDGILPREAESPCTNARGCTPRESASGLPLKGRQSPMRGPPAARRASNDIARAAGGPERRSLACPGPGEKALQLRSSPAFSQSIPGIGRGWW